MTEQLDLAVEAELADAAFQTVDTSDVETIEIPTTETEPQPKKSKRGGARPGAGKKKKKPEPEPTQTGEGTTGTVDDELAQASSGFNPDEYEEVKIETAEQKALISGIVLLHAINFFAPSLLLRVYSAVDPRAEQVNPDSVRLEKDELEVLKPAADAVAMEIFSKMSPIMQLIIGFSVLVGAKIGTEIQMISNQEGNGE